MYCLVWRLPTVGILGEETVAVLQLEDERRRDRPIVVQIDLQRRARAVGVDAVEVFLGIRVVVDGDGRNAEARIAGISALAGYVVDIARVMLAPGHDADCDVVRQRHVDVALGGVAFAAMRHGVALHVIGGRETARVRLVGDDADGAGFRAGAVKRALGAGKYLHAIDVVEMHVERAADRRDRLFVQINADGGQRARVVAVIAADDAAHADIGEAGRGVAASGAAGCEGDAGEELHVVVEVGDVQLLELFRLQRLDAHGDRLEIFRALLRRDDDGLNRAVVCRLLRQRRNHRCQHGGGRQRGPKRAPTTANCIGFHDVPRKSLVARCQTRDKGLSSFGMWKTHKK